MKHDAISSFFVCVFAVSCLNYLLLDSYSLHIYRNIEIAISLPSHSNIMVVSICTVRIVSRIRMYCWHCLITLLCQLQMTTFLYGVAIF